MISCAAGGMTAVGVGCSDLFGQEDILAADIQSAANLYETTVIRTTIENSAPTSLKTFFWICWTSILCREPSIKSDTPSNK
jgi:hypothetical protein